MGSVSRLRGATGGESSEKGVEKIRVIFMRVTSWPGSSGIGLRIASAVQ